MLEQELENLSYIQIVNILDHESLWVLIMTTQLCGCSTETATDNV